MLTHGTPWQAVLGHVAEMSIVFFIAMLLSLTSGYYNWWILYTVIFFAVGLIIIIRLIPTMLNLSRSYFTFIASLYLFQILVTIITFALHHKAAGLIGPEGRFDPGYRDALYFSVTTFTTLGYGDLQPLPEMRLATSVEALTGMISVALAIPIIWLWCKENLIDKDMAFFDGYRRHKKSLQISRIRVRTITGKERRLKDWRPTPQIGESYYYDKQHKEWLEVTPDMELPVNTLVIGITPEWVDRD